MPLFHSSRNVLEKPSSLIIDARTLQWVSQDELRPYGWRHEFYGVVPLHDSDLQFVEEHLDAFIAAAARMEH